MKRFVALSRKVNFAPHRSLLVGLLLISFGFAGCSGQLGRIEPSVVDVAIADAEASLTAARDVDALSLAPDLFEAAEVDLEAARTALTEKNGNEALRLAYQSIANARLARKNAINIAKNAELNAAILQKEATAEELRQTLDTKAAALAKSQSQMQDIQREEQQLKQTIRDLQKQNQELSNTRKTYGAQVAQLSKTLEEVQVRARRAATDIRNYGKELSELRRKLEVADQMVNEEGHQKRAAIAENDSLRKQLREQAEIYTDKLARANQQRAGAKHEEYVKQKAKEARAYVDSQPKLHPDKTGRTSLSTEQIAMGKAALHGWERAWQAKNLNGHLAYYEPNVVADKVVIQESKESRSKIDRQQLETDLHQMNAHAWTKAKTSTEVEGENVIGVQRLSRLVAPAVDENATALYNIWVREVWMHPVGNNWKIHHEIWQIYENVPNF